MDQAMAGLLGAAIGAAGAVAAQVIAAVFSQRSTNKRFAWEQDTVERREQVEREQRFLELKRELYASFLSAHSTFRSKLGRHPARPSEEAARELVDAWVGHLDHAQQIKEEIALVAPALSDTCGDLMVASAEAFTGLIREQPSVGGTVDRGFAEYGGEITRCRAAMSTDLGTADDESQRQPADS